MSEYLLTDLPRYVKTAPRENFANSIVKEGAVLLFSEDGETLVAKHPDGTFTEIGSGGGASAEYYKCASVSEGAAAPEGATFTMQLTLKAFSATLTYQWVMDDTSKTGTARTWTAIIDGQTSKLQINDIYWQIDDGLGSTIATAISDDPWDITSWYNPDGGDVSCAFSDISPAASGSNTWSGYKAVFDSTAGTWSFESGVTEGLAYTSVTPVVGGIYSADALVNVASVYTGFYATSAPVNPAGATDGDWIISASSNLDSNRNCIYAFHETTGHDNYCWHSQSGMPQWIQWQNTAQKVLIKSYILTQRDSAGSYSSTWTLSGSDDGENWVELDNVSLDTVSASQAIVRNLPSNNTMYYYHRITVTKSDITGTNYATIGRIQAFNHLQE